uniref:Uncharacterized protein n=1 Tax=Schistocephalus solidus TaxID=70667 RepID=A0A0V0J9V3_SCHSO
MTGVSRLSPQHPNLCPLVEPCVSPLWAAGSAPHPFLPYRRLENTAPKYLFHTSLLLIKNGQNERRREQPPHDTHSYQIKSHPMEELRARARSRSPQNGKIIL